MRKIKKLKLTLTRLTVRTLASPELARIAGGEPITGPIDLCAPASPHQSCPGCQSINIACDPSERCQTIHTNCEACP